jgi:hypothetical protein
MNDQFHAPVALTPEKVPILIDSEADWTPEPVWTLWWIESLYVCRNIVCTAWLEIKSERRVLGWEFSHRWFFMYPFQKFKVVNPSVNAHILPSHPIYLRYTLRVSVGLRLYLLRLLFEFCVSAALQICHGCPLPGPCILASCSVSLWKLVRSLRNLVLIINGQLKETSLYVLTLTVILFLYLSRRFQCA